MRELVTPTDVLAANVNGARTPRNAPDDEATRVRRKYHFEPTAVVVTEARFLHDQLPQVARYSVSSCTRESRSTGFDAPCPEHRSTALLDPEDWRTWTIGLEREWEAFSHQVRHQDRRLPVGVGHPEGWEHPSS